MNLQKLMKGTLFSLTIAFLASCGYPSHRLGAEADKDDPQLKGTEKMEVMFNGASAQKHLTIDGTALKSKNEYVYDGSVTINGDVPRESRIIVHGGKLDVTGNVGSQSEINVDLPVRTHQETHIVLVPIYHSMGKYGGYTTLVPMPVTNTITDGLLYEADNGPALKVNGTVGDTVTVATNAGVEAKDWGVMFKCKTDWGRPLVKANAALQMAH